FILPTIAAIVACEKDDDDNYHDFNVPEKNLKTLTLSNGENGQLSPFGKALPCPTFCSKLNVLNS
ncbi:MAG TPA: hypothetical protein VN958_18965, partial [Chitinophagaceae bacterium]|nr:hypothetical protein [Chitinophagaceae bacterium]